MKLLRLRSLFITCFILIGSFSSCKKSGNDDSSFTWTYKGVNYEASFAAVHYVEDLGSNITGGLGNSAINPGSGPQFRIFPLTVGTHNFGIGAPNSFLFIDEEGYMFSGTGSMAITNSSNNRFSANFTATLNQGTGGASYPLTGIIKNIKMVP